MLQDWRKRNQGVSRSTLYRLVDKSHLELIKISDRASGITATSYAAYIERQQAVAPEHNK